MSAMRALALPETDAASLPAAAWTVPAQAARIEPVPAEPARTGPARGQSARTEPVPVQPGRAKAARRHTGPSLAAPGTAVRRRPALGAPARGEAVRSQAATAPLRLTRRGRVVVAAAAALLVSVLSLLAAGTAQATSHSVPSRVADRNLTQVVVHPGQSLWSVAQNADPNADPQQVIQQIIELNGLTSDAILAGQRLWVPRG
jgi:LysM repeat protein